MRNSTIIFGLCIILALCTTVSAATLVQPYQINRDWSGYELNITNINTYTAANITYLNVTIQSDEASLWVKGNANISGHQFNSTTVSINGDLLINTGVIIQGVGQMSVSNITSPGDLLLMPTRTVNVTKDIIVGSTNVSASGVTIGATNITSDEIRTTNLIGDYCPYGNCAIINITSLTIETPPDGSTGLLILDYGGTGMYFYGYGIVGTMTVAQMAPLLGYDPAILFYNDAAIKQDYPIIEFADFNETSTGNLLSLYTYGPQKTLDISAYGNSIAFNIYSESIYPPMRIEPNITGVICNSTYKGGIYYNSITSTHYGCNSTDWNALY